ncbi:MAG: GMC family oxidoreductase [Legionellales bacterium]
MSMRMIPILLVTLTALLFQTAYANPLFTVNASGIPGNASFTLCLNGIGQISCQNYNASMLNLSITTTIPGRTYNEAGIRINSGPSLEQLGVTCKQIVNDFCIFSVSNTSPYLINLKVPDYLIIGAGTAGSVLARTLSDDSNLSVVALHNGSNFNQNSLITLSSNSILAVLNALIGAPFYTLNATTPQPDANNRAFSWVYALPFGGASAVNASGYARGTTQMYAQWESINGSNWSTARILNTFKELENYTGLTITPNARGTDGLLPVWQQPTVARMSYNVFLPALLATLPGIPVVVDYNDPSVSNCIDTRAQYTQMGVNAGLRASSATAFLNNTIIDNEGNGVNGRHLQVLFNATANNIIWKGNTAVGVTYYQNGVLKKIYADKGVIVTAGIKSSTLLMRSGVGPASLLNSLKIPVVYNNPNVGQNLKDQFRVLFIYHTNPSDSPSNPLLSIATSIVNALANTTVGQQLLFYIGSSVTAQNSLFFQTAWMPLVGGSAGDPRAFRFMAINPIPGYAVVLLDLLQPKSSGSIVINSTNPFSEPTMNLGIFTNPDDLTNMSNAISVYIKNFTDQIALLDPQYQMVYPDPAILSNSIQLRDFIVSTIDTDMHFQGHCKMAPLNQGGVVNSTGHVYGTNNLIVADDSIAPVAMDGAPMASAYMIAANIANLIQNGA